jgi:hypothetical protein
MPIPDLVACFRGRPQEGIDWERTILAANHTLTTGTMAERLLRADAANLPDDVRSFLETILERTMERNKRLTEQAAEAILQLNRSGIRPILMKGMAIHQTMGDRHFLGRILSDIDLMVPAKATTEAQASLREIGYEPHADADRSISALFRPRDTGMIDLHCRLKTPVPRFDYERIEHYCAVISVGGAEALLPNPTLQTLILVLHDQLQDRDYWRGLIDLRHLLDIQALSGTPEGVDWALLSSFFPPGYPLSALKTQLRTIATLLDVPVPRRFYVGLWPYLQYRRRIVQARRPVLMRMLTLLTLMIDPPRFHREPRLGRPSAPNHDPSLKRPLAKIWSRAHRYGRQKAAGKI